MKKLAIILLLGFFASCSSNETIEETNPLIGTKWTAQDLIANQIYGNGCTTTIEFLTETTCQEINVIPRGTFAGTTVLQGTYSVNGDKVGWTVNTTSKGGTVSGSAIISTIVVNGNPITYLKN